MATRKKKNNIGAFGHPIYGKGFAKYGEMRTNDSSEIPNDLEEAAMDYSDEHNDECFDACGLVCQHIIKAFIAGAKWQKEQCKLKVSDDIEEEIESYIPHLDIPYAELTDEIYHLCVLIARHFAEWQKAQDDKYVDTIYQQGIEKGKDDMKELMLKDAVEGIYNNSDWGTPCIDLPSPLELERFDKVRIIIVKEGEE